MEDNTKTVDIKVSERFISFIGDWDYSTYLVLGGYGSGKSWHIALKVILKCLKEKRKVLVCRNVYETIRDSCFALFKDILSSLGLLSSDEKHKGTIVVNVSPMQIKFPNGSLIIFRGMDDPNKLKSIHGVSIVWVEECSEIKFTAYEELIGRVRENNVSLHFILSCNPVGKENWVYTHFFRYLDDEGNETVILDEEKLYRKKELVHNGIYYHHSVPTDNPFLPVEYVKRLLGLALFDPYLFRVAYEGRFGTTGTRVLPQFVVAKDAKEFRTKVLAIPDNFHFIGMDFGFEESFNAVVKMAVDDKEKVLYIYDEIYVNHITDDKMANLPEMQRIKESDKWIVADSAEPKTITYYRQLGFKMRPCKKFIGSRLANTRKIKRFKQIVCSPKCTNTIRELKDLTYAKDSKGNIIYDEFNIDPHTFSAIWYGLDSYTVADYKYKKYHSKNGE